MLTLHSKEMLLTGKEEGYLKVSADGPNTDTCIGGNSYGTPFIYGIDRSTNANYKEISCGAIQYTGRGFSQTAYSGSTALSNNSQFTMIDSGSNYRRCLTWNLTTPTKVSGIVVTGGNGGTASGNTQMIMQAWCKTTDNTYIMSNNTNVSYGQNAMYKIEILFNEPKTIYALGVVNTKRNYGSLFFGAGMYIKTAKGKLKYEDIPGTSLYREVR